MPDRQIVVIKDSPGCLPGCGMAGCGAVLGTLLTLAIVFAVCSGILAVLVEAGKAK